MSNSRAGKIASAGRISRSGPRYCPFSADLKAFFRSPDRWSGPRPGDDGGKTFRTTTEAAKRPPAPGGEALRSICGALPAALIRQAAAGTVRRTDTSRSSGPHRTATKPDDGQHSRRTRRDFRRDKRSRSGITGAGRRPQGTRPAPAHTTTDAGRGMTTSDEPTGRTKTEREDEKKWKRRRAAFPLEIPRSGRQRSASLSPCTDAPDAPATRRAMRQAT